MLLNSNQLVAYFAYGIKNQCNAISSSVKP